MDYEEEEKIGIWDTLLCRLFLCFFHLTFINVPKRKRDWIYIVLNLNRKQNKNQTNKMKNSREKRKKPLSHLENCSRIKSDKTKKKNGRICFIVFCMSWSTLDFH